MRAVVLVASLVAAAAFGQPADPKAASRAAWRAGAEAYDKGDFNAAIRRFEEAYAMEPTPLILFNIGQAQRRKGDPRRALETFRKYLAVKPDAQNRALVEDLIRELERSVPPPAPPAPEPPPVVSPEPPGPVIVASTTSPWYRDTIGIATTAGGTVATAVGIGLLVHAAGVADEAETLHDETSAIERNSDAKTLRLWGAITTGAGVAALGVGIARFAFVRRAQSSREVTVTVGAAWIGIGGSF